MNRFSVFLIVLLLSPVALPAISEDEAALLLAWEQAQRADPKTQLFERTGERTYRFRTERFPYDGVVQVMTLAVQPEMPKSDFQRGIVEVKLDRSNSELSQQYPMSFPLWSENNELVKDGPSGRWLTIKEWSVLRQQRFMAQPWWQRRDLAPLGIVALLGVVLFGAVAAAIRYQLTVTRKMRDDDLVRQRLLVEAGGMAARDARILKTLERQQRLLTEVLSSASDTRRWRSRHRAADVQAEPEIISEVSLTELQRTRLQLYLSLRDQDDARPFMRSQKVPPRAWAMRAVVLFCLAGLLALGAMQTFLFALGIVVGFILMGLTTRESFVQLWPALRRSLDWRRVEALLQERH